METKMKRLMTAIVLLFILQVASGMQYAINNQNQPLLDRFNILNYDDDALFDENHPELCNYKKTCCDKIVDSIADCWNAFYESPAGWIPLIFGGWLVILLKSYVKWSFAPVNNLNDFYEQTATWMQINFVTDFLGEIIHKAGYNSYERATKLEFFQNLQLFHFMILSIKLLIYYSAATTAKKKQPDYNPLMLHPNISGSPLGRFSTWTSKKLLKLGETIHGKNTFLGLIAWFGIYSVFHFTATWAALFAFGKIPGEARNANIPESCDISGSTYFQNIACIFEQAKWALGAWVPPILSGHLSVYGMDENPAWITWLALVSYILLLTSGLFNLFYIKVVKLASAQLAQIAGSSNTCLFRYCKCLRLYMDSNAFVMPDLTDLDAKSAIANENYNKRKEEKYQQLISTAKCYKSCNVKCLKFLTSLTVLTPPLMAFGGFFYWALTASGFYSDPSYDLTLISLFIPIAIVMYMSSFYLYRKSIAEKRYKWDPVAWKKFRLRHFLDVFWSKSYILQLIGSAFDFGLVSTYVPLMIKTFLDYMVNCEYIPTGVEWADKHYCRDFGEGENFAKSPLLLRSLIVLMGYGTLTFVVFPLFGFIKFNMVHNSERKFIEFTTRVTVLDFNKQRVENWIPGHITAFIASSDKGIGGSHCRDLDKYVNSQNLTGLKVLEIVKTQEIVDFYLLFNELAKTLPWDLEGQELTKKKLLHLLGNLYLVARNIEYRDKIKKIYEVVESIVASEICSLQDDLKDDKGRKMNILDYVKLKLQFEYIGENEKEITFAGLNQLRRFKEKMEYIFDTKNHEQEYKGYGLVKEGNAVHGPGEYKWVEQTPSKYCHSKEYNQNEESLQSFKSDHSSKKNCFSLPCTEEPIVYMTEYVKESDEYCKPTFMREKAIENIKMLDEAAFAACTVNALKQRIKDKLHNEFSAEDPVRVYKVERMEGRVWGLMKLKMLDKSEMSDYMIEKEFSFWIPFRGQDGEYLKPNNNKTRAVRFPVEDPNMNFLDYELPSPQYDLASSKERKLSALSESRYNVFRKFCQKINEIYEEERVDTKNKLRRMSQEFSKESKVINI